MKNLSLKPITLYLLPVGFITANVVANSVSQIALAKLEQLGGNLGLKFQRKAGLTSSLARS